MYFVPPQYLTPFYVPDVQEILSKKQKRIEGESSTFNWIYTEDNRIQKSLTFYCSEFQYVSNHCGQLLIRHSHGPTQGEIQILECLKRVPYKMWHIFEDNLQRNEVPKLATSNPVFTMSPYTVRNAFNSGLPRSPTGKIQTNKQKINNKQTNKRRNK